MALNQVKYLFDLAGKEKGGILHYNSLLIKPINHAHEHLTDESFYQGKNENFQPLY